MSLSPGTRLGRYEVVRLLGAGGMGEVYLATDARLEREVALKVLPAGTLEDDAARRRFRNEALALSRLSHPNIETVYDFDTHEGVDFLVMEYIPGGTLDEKLQAGPLPEAELLRLGVQLADALACAHDHGVQHRDLKPANLLVMPDGRLRILDFGLARLLRPAGEMTRAETISLEGDRAGTPPYMAPEQLRGDPVDRRTDIFALGDVLYEMAAGRRAFHGVTAASLTDAILRQTPVAPRALNRRISPEVERVILKCLEKDPADRYQSMTEVGVDLRRLASAASGDGRLEVRPRIRRLAAPAAGVSLVVLLAVLLAWALDRLRERAPVGTAAGRIESIAVLPFKNLMGDPDQEYFVEGMHEALIADLAKIGALRVISRTSVMRYRDTRRPLPQIAEELGVDAVVEGSVLRAGDRVRITAQLVHAPSDSHLWADSYQGALRDIMGLQSETARAIAREIATAVTPEEEARLTRGRRVDPGAYEAYLMGRYHLNKRTLEGVTAALGYFQRAVDEDPNNGLAHAGLADAYTVLGWYNWGRPSEVFPKARTAALEALAADDTLAEAHTSLAVALMNHDLDWQGAERRFQRAIALNPSYPTAHHWYALLLAFTGRGDEAIAEIERARELDPLSLIINTIVGYIHYHVRRYDEAIRHIDRVFEMDPDFLLAHGVAAMANVQLGRYDEAVAAARRVYTLSGESPDAMADLILVYALTDRSKEALEMLADLKKRPEWKKMTPGWMAMIHLALGDHDRAVDLLEKARAERSWIVTTLGSDPLYDPLRRDPRFQDLLRRVGLRAHPPG